MILINLFGAPGTGKSTGVAYIFSQLKMRGVNAELVTEFAKDKTWEHNMTALSNQAYVFGKQYYRISRCADQVDVIVTDSPLLLSLVYNNSSVLGQDFNKVVKAVADSFNSRNYYLTRVKPYNPAGRNQTEEEADQIADQIYEILVKEKVPFSTKPGHQPGYQSIVENILDELGLD